MSFLVFGIDVKPVKCSDASVYLCHGNSGLHKSKLVNHMFSPPSLSIASNSVPPQALRPRR